MTPSISPGSNPSNGQTKTDKRVVFIEFSESAVSIVESTRSSATGKNTPHKTGLDELDRLNKRYKLISSERVFRSGGNFESRHRRFGLHKWYRFSFRDEIPLKDYESLDSVTRVHFKNGFKLNNTVPNDPSYGDQWHYNRIELEDAWDIERGSGSVIVHVADSGVDINHPDLSAIIWTNPSEVPGNGIDDDNNGYIDDINGWDFVNDDNNPNDDLGHGTHVAGTIGAISDNGTGVAGVAGGSGSGGVWILPTRVIDGTTDDGNMASSFVYAADHGAVISNNSWACSSFNCDPPVIDVAIDYFEAIAGGDGGIVVFAAGNDDANTPNRPADHASALAVGATNTQYNKASYSNYGNWVDISAPGGNAGNSNPGQIYSTLPNNDFEFKSGTSMAAPHVAGLLALILSLEPSLSNEEAKYLLLQTRDGFGVGGQINARRALEALAHLQQYYIPGGYPWIIKRNVSTSLSKTGSSNGLTLTALGGHDAATLASGVYYGNRAELRATETITGAWRTPLFAWGIRGASKGWNAGNPNNQTGFCEVTGVTNNSVNLRTFNYELTNVLGQITGTHPSSASAATCAYGVIALPKMCIPPSSGDWNLMQDCYVYRPEIIPANLTIDNNATLTVTASGSMDVDFLNHHILIKTGSKLKILAGGKVD